MFFIFAIADVLCSWLLGQELFPVMSVPWGLFCLLPYAAIGSFLICTRSAQS